MTTSSHQSFKIAVGVDVQCNGATYTITHITSSSDVIARRLEGNVLEALPIHKLSPIETAQGSEDGVVKKRDLSLYTEAEWLEAERRLSIIKPLLDLSGRKAKDVENVAVSSSINRATVYKWLKAYADSGQLVSLIPERRGRKSGTNLLSAELDVLISATIQECYLTNQKLRPNVICEEVERRCKNAGLTPPHANTVRNRLKNLPAAHVLRKTGRKDKARDLYVPILGEFPGAKHPLAVVQIDHTPCDIMLVDDVHRKSIGRPWLTLAIDVYSRMVVGYYLSFDAPSAVSVGICLSRAILPKEGLLAEMSVIGKWPVHGFMSVVHADNAKEFRGHMLRRACKEYSIDLHLRPVKTPHYGGHIERLMGSLATELRKLPGATFNRPEERKGYNSEDEAVLTLGEYETLLVEFLINRYNARYHKGIDMAPLRKWEIGLLGDGSTPGVGLPDRPLNTERIQTDFLPYQERTIQNYGVQMEGMHYYSEALSRWIGAKDKSTGKPRQFVFRYDPRNISAVHFFDPDIQEYIKIPTRELALPAMSRGEYKSVRKMLKSEGLKHIDEAAIAKSVERQRALIFAAAGKTKAARRSAQVVLRNSEIAQGKMMNRVPAGSRVTADQATATYDAKSKVTSAQDFLSSNALSTAKPQKVLSSPSHADIFSQDIQPFD